MSRAQGVDRDRSDEIDAGWTPRRPSAAARTGGSSVGLALRPGAGGGRRRAPAVGPVRAGGLGRRAARGSDRARLAAAEDPDHLSDRRQLHPLDGVSAPADGQWPPRDRALLAPAGHRRGSPRPAGDPLVRRPVGRPPERPGPGLAPGALAGADLLLPGCAAVCGRGPARLRRRRLFLQVLGGRRDVGRRAGRLGARLRVRRSGGCLVPPRGRSVRRRAPGVRRRRPGPPEADAPALRRPPRDGPGDGPGLGPRAQNDRRQAAPRPRGRSWSPRCSWRSWWPRSWLPRRRASSRSRGPRRSGGPPTWRLCATSPGCSPERRRRGSRSVPGSAPVAGLAALWRERRRLALYSVSLVATQVAAVLLVQPYGVRVPVIAGRYLLIVLPVLLLWQARGLVLLWDGFALARRRGAARRSAALPRGGRLGRPAPRGRSRGESRGDPSLRRGAGAAAGPVRRQRRGGRAHLSAALVCPRSSVPEAYRLIRREPGAGAVVVVGSASFTGSDLLDVALWRVHRRPVIACTGRRWTDDPRLALRTLVPVRPERVAATGARFVALQLDRDRLWAIEEELRTGRRSRPPRPAVRRQRERMARRVRAQVPRRLGAAAAHLRQRPGLGPERRQEWACSGAVR